jgi:hypothetical protein
LSPSNKLNLIWLVSANIAFSSYGEDDGLINIQNTSQDYFQNFNTFSKILHTAIHDPRITQQHKPKNSQQYTFGFAIQNTRKSLNQKPIDNTEKKQNENLE